MAQSHDGTGDGRSGNSGSRSAKKKAAAARDAGPAATASSAAAGDAGTLADKASKECEEEKQSEEDAVAEAVVPQQGAVPSVDPVAPSTEEAFEAEFEPAGRRAGSQRRKGKASQQQNSQAVAEKEPLPENSTSTSVAEEVFDSEQLLSQAVRGLLLLSDDPAEVAAKAETEAAEADAPDAAKAAETIPEEEGGADADATVVASATPAATTSGTHRGTRRRTGAARRRLREGEPTETAGTSEPPPATQVAKPEVERARALPKEPIVRQPLSPVRPKAANTRGGNVAREAQEATGPTPAVARTEAQAQGPRALSGRAAAGATPTPAPWAAVAAGTPAAPNPAPAPTPAPVPAAESPVPAVPTAASKDLSAKAAAWTPSTPAPENADARRTEDPSAEVKPADAAQKAAAVPETLTAAATRPEAAQAAPEDEVNGKKASPEAEAADATQPPAKRKPYAQVVAQWAKPDAEMPLVKASSDGQRRGMGGADAPEFVPGAGGVGMELPSQEVTRARRRRRPRKAAVEGTVDVEPTEGSSDTEEGLIHTLYLSGIPAALGAEEFKDQMDAWGLQGCYNFLYMQTNKLTGHHVGHALVNFIDSAFVVLCHWILEVCRFEGCARPSDFQGLEACIQHWKQNCEPVTGPARPGSPSAPLVSETVPSQWAVNMTNELLYPHFRGQFHKTKLCAFHKAGRCSLDVACPFAHSREELQPAPDLARTKLCYKYFVGKCVDQQCRYAHGSRHLQQVRMPNLFYNSGMYDEPWGLNSVEPMSAYDMCMDVGSVAFGSADGAPAWAGAFLRGDGAELAMVDENYRDGFDSQMETMHEGSAASSTTTPTEPPSNVILPSEKHHVRQRGTFYEALQVRDEEPLQSMQRSWSEGDLNSLREAMEDCDFL